MTLIDQRILIPAPMPAVWQVIADHKQLPQWRSDVATVSVLSTRADGVGARRRITPKDSRKDIIEEISVWYDGIGYEYRLIEGNPFKSFVSRLRLQATPDGTIIQWTISFEPRGFLARLFTSGRHRRRLEQVVVGSLRQLRRFVDQQGVKIDQEYRDKTRVKEGFSADYRAEYGAKIVARQQSDVAQIPSSIITQTAAVTITEPPVKLDDTPSVARVSPPSFLAEALQGSDVAIEPRPQQQDTRPTSPIIVTKEEAPTLSPVDEAIASLKGEEDTPKTDTKPKRPAGLDEAIAANRHSQEMAPVKSETTAPTDGDLPPPTDIRDTGQISIWDVFGVTRPKDELSTIIDELKAAPGETPPPAPAVASTSSVAVEAEKKAVPLDLWLALNEPPLPASATGSISAMARPSEKFKPGLRRQPRLRRLRLRRPRTD